MQRTGEGFAPPVQCSVQDRAKEGCQLWPYGHVFYWEPEWSSPMYTSYSIFWLKGLHCGISETKGGSGGDGREGGWGGEGGHSLYILQKGRFDCF
jgi:hypothetical protein